MELRVVYFRNCIWHLEIFFPSAVQQQGCPSRSCELQCSADVTLSHAASSHTSFLTLLAKQTFQCCREVGKIKGRTNSETHAEHVWKNQFPSAPVGWHGFPRCVCCLKSLVYLVKWSTCTFANRLKIYSPTSLPHIHLRHFHVWTNIHLWKNCIFVSWSWRIPHGSTWDCLIFLHQHYSAQAASAWGPVMHSGLNSSPVQWYLGHHPLGPQVVLHMGRSNIPSIGERSILLWSHMRPIGSVTGGLTHHFSAPGAVSQ